ncbi:MAG: glycosyltransferase family 4 protein [bacterium]|nr:glycosyltransferase family 4 protein [Candidatus Kapabacteria bacterium]
MRILVINWQDWTNPLAGGAEAHLRETFRRIAAMGHDVTLFCSSYPGASADEMIEGIRIVRRGERNTFNFGVRRAYRELTSNEHYDVVVDDLNKIPFYTPMFVTHPLVAISHHFFGSSIFLEAGVIQGSYVYFAEKLVDLVYRNTRFLVVSNSTLDEFVRRGFPRENFTLALNGLDHETLHPTGVPKSAHPTIGYFGRLKKYKSPDHLVRAFARVREQIANAELVFIGRGDYQPELEKLANDLGITVSTRFAGFVSEEEKLRLLQELWVVVNPSMKEGWGIVNAEANACGTPAIAADSPGLRDSVQHGHNGLLYPYGDVDTLTEHLLLVLRDNELRARLEKGALEFAKTLSWDDTAQTTLNVLQQTIDQHAAAARK